MAGAPAAHAVPAVQLDGTVAFGTGSSPPFWLSKTK
jgi:hypothetical protein